jgi:hypothetical protein
MINNYMGIFCLALCVFIRKSLVAPLCTLFMLLPCPIALTSITASHSVTGSLEVPAHGMGHCEFCFGQSSVLLEDHPSPQPLQRGVRAHNLLSLVLNLKHVCSAPLTLSD